jgi:hypothetical protein
MFIGEDYIRSLWHNTLAENSSQIVIPMIQLICKWHILTLTIKIPFCTKIRFVNS